MPEDMGETTMQGGSYSTDTLDTSRSYTCQLSTVASVLLRQQPW